MRNRSALLLSIGMGLVAVLLMAVYLTSRENRLLELADPKDVLVATSDILANTVIDEGMIQRIQVPAKYQQPKGLGDAREAVGRVVAVAVPRGAQLLGTYLQDAAHSAFGHQVPRGRRAVTIAVSDVTGVGGLVRPADFVDILGTFEFGRSSGGGGQGGRPGGTADERTETRTLMQNVLVVAAGQEYIGERADARSQDQTRTMGGQAAQAQATAAAARARDVKNVTVLVAPQQVQELVLAQQIGTLTLSLRSNLDEGQVVDMTTLDPNTLLHVQIPLKSRQTPPWREIRGAPSSSPFQFQ
jgi:pilus assembly protein CpaB